MPRMTYSGTAGATVTYGITKPDKSVDTAPTGTGVTADIVGTSRTAYSVVVADTKRGMTIDWYEGGQYVASEEIPDDVLTPLGVVDDKVDGIVLEVEGLDGAAIPTDYAKAGEAASALTTYDVPARADITAARDAVIDAIDGNVTGDVLVTDETRLDANGNIVEAPDGTPIGVNVPGASIDAYLRSDTYRVDAKRHSTVEADGTWAIALPPGIEWTLVFALDGYYDPETGESTDDYEVTT